MIDSNWWNELNSFFIWPIPVLMAYVNKEKTTIAVNNDDSIHTFYTSPNL